MTTAPAHSPPFSEVAPLEHLGSRPRPRRRYVRLRSRFALTVAAGLLWTALSLWIALPWIADLGQTIGRVGALALIAGVALIPGYLNMQLAAALLLDRPVPLRLDLDYPPITLVMAVYNEASRVEETIRYAARQDYPGELEILVADDGSNDHTRAIVAGAARDNPVRLLTLPHSGKAGALNRALALVETPLLATVDADTLLLPSSLRRAVARLLLSPPDTVAVAGSVLARNSRSSVVTRIQQWDYILGIAAIKRQQAFLQGTLVAQGAFSVYETAAVRAVGGWPDRLGEDIVLTWALLRAGCRVTHEPTAFAFTETPTTLRALARQRRRWARGLIEGLREHGAALLRRRRMFVHSIVADAVFPYLDTVYTLAVPAGIALAAFGDFAILGPLTAAVLPLNGLITLLMLRQEVVSFRAAGIRVRKRPPDILSLLLYALVLQLFLAPVCVTGYVAETLGLRRSW